MRDKYMRLNRTHRVLVWIAFKRAISRDDGEEWIDVEARCPETAGAIPAVLFGHTIVARKSMFLANVPVKYSLGLNIVEFFYHTMKSLLGIFLSFRRSTCGVNIH